MTTEKIKFIKDLIEDWRTAAKQCRAVDREAEARIYEECAEMLEGAPMDKATELLIKLMRTMRCEHLDMKGVTHHCAYGMYVCDVCNQPELTSGISNPVIKEIKADLDEGIRTHNRRGEGS